MDPTLGDNIARHRRRQRLTQEQLAEHAGLSVETIRKLETNSRTSSRLPTIGRLARALGVRTTDLLGDATSAAARREPDHLPLSLIDIRRALTPARGPGGTVRLPDGPPPTLPTIRSRLRAADQAYHRGDYGTVLGILPSLITSGRLAVETASARARPQAHAALADVCYLTGELLIQLRAGDLAYTAISSALDAAEAAGDPILGALTVKGASWLLLRQGRLAEAEQLAVSTADRVEPRMSRAQPEELAVWGWLLLFGAAAAARDQRPDDATEMLDSAAAAGARLGDRPIPGRLAIVGGFRSARAEMARVEAAAVTGDPAAVLRLSERMPVTATVPTSQRRHQLDVAWAHVQTGQYADATQVLTRLSRQAPAWLRHQRYARDIVADLAAARRRAMGAELAELAALVGC
ncbi:helix-turn-helix transcriptional regulator [Micromonospora sp. WMMD1102]|uniref:helix-turn-helix domain-containing protein n=1 Tax=Micromonospora sp. WMMD1102 TaxID=3016105 RepID=UPI0024153E75|nr:helix-turn-helix transcriptional regulator [Micromonospora sp. WMMD1102]MDG4784371.1 helix-turn-helix transcriptional regulator [Micromonospora sp. WMMD1102]MDG4792214.1 helix-turn-helix transcriptional regulator [Micromonospora sp. WMMD1102]